MFYFLKTFIRNYIISITNSNVTWSFRSHTNMLIWCSRNISCYFQCWKQLCWRLLCSFFQDSLCIKSF